MLKNSDQSARPVAALPPSTQRRNDLRRALTELDEESAARYIVQVMETYLTEKIQGVEAFALDLRNTAYAELDPLQSTRLFAERYQLIVEGGLYKWGGAFKTGLESGLVNASLSTIRNVWLARQYADFLGMDYDEYIHVMVRGHLARGSSCPPPLRAMHGKTAFAVGAYANQGNPWSAVAAVA